MKKWKCTVCGYIHTGDEPPEKCPVCGAPKSKFIDVSEPETPKPEPAPAAVSEEKAEARQAARIALMRADLILFCADINKPSAMDNYTICRLLENQSFLAIATQCDRITESELPGRLKILEKEFGFSFLPTSARTGAGLEDLKTQIRRTLLNLRGTGHEGDQRITVNQRHRQILTEAAAALTEAKTEMQKSHEEVAAMLLRGTWQQLGGIQREDVEEAILEQIFSRFCIGK